MDYFKVDIENGEMHWIPCSNFPEPAFPGSGMRVNCDQYRSLHTGIRVQSRLDLGLSISEIEVHTLSKLLIFISIAKNLLLMLLQIVLIS